jgi:hypothetical protein
MTRWQVDIFTDEPESVHPADVSRSRYVAAFFSGCLVWCFLQCPWSTPIVIHAAVKTRMKARPACLCTSGKILRCEVVVFVCSGKPLLQPPDPRSAPSQLQPQVQYKEGLTAVHVHLIIAEVQHKASHSKLEISSTIAPSPPCPYAARPAPSHWATCWLSRSQSPPARHPIFHTPQRHCSHREAWRSCTIQRSHFLRLRHRDK